MHPLGQHHCKILPRSPRPLCLHRECASELATAHTESLLAAPQKEQNVFVPQTPACCHPSFTASEAQAGWAVPLPPHPYHKGEKLSLAASAVSVLKQEHEEPHFSLYQSLCHEGPETRWECAGRQGYREFQHNCHNSASIAALQFPALVFLASHHQPTGSNPRR